MSSYIITYHSTDGARMPVTSQLVTSSSF